MFGFLLLLFILGVLLLPIVLIVKLVTSSAKDVKRVATPPVMEKRLIHYYDDPRTGTHDAWVWNGEDWVKQ